MARSILRSGLLALGLIAATPASIMAQSAPRLLSPGCTLAALPDSETFCQMPNPTSALDSVTVVVGSSGRSGLLESYRVAAAFGLNGVRALRSGADPVIASHGGDVDVTGSIATPDARR